MFTDDFETQSLTVYQSFAPKHHRRRESYGRKNHSCEKCGKTYVSEKSVVRHVRYECGMPRRFKCPYCEISIRQQTHAWGHIRVNHPDREVYCIDVITKETITPRSLCKYYPNSSIL